MFISATAVMKQINQMEAKLDMQLFERTPKGLLLHLQVNRIIGMLNL